MAKKVNQISQLLDYCSPSAVLKEAFSIFISYYPQKDFEIVKKSFSLIIDLFAGDYSGYLKCLTEYHDLNHTMDAFLATARLLDGKNFCEKPLSCRLSVYLLLSSTFS